MRIQNRIDGAVARAAARYCGTFTATTADGGVMSLVAVKRDADFDAVDSAISSRRFEFVVAPSSARLLIKLASCRSNQTTASDERERLPHDARGSANRGPAPARWLDALRKVVIREFIDGEQVAEYRIDAARPLAENTPSGGVLRLFTYQTKG